MPRFKPRSKRKAKRAGLPPNVTTAAPAPPHRQYVWGRRGLKVQKEPKHGK